MVKERRKLWERLGASSNAGGTAPQGYAHLLDAVAPASKVGSGGAQQASGPAGSGRIAGGGRQRGATRTVLRMGYSAHREKFAKALRLELEEEMARAAERLESWDAGRLQREGYALFGLRGMHEGTLQRDAIVRVLIPRGRDPATNPSPVNDPNGGPPRRQFMMGQELPFHRFGQGDMVSLVEGDVHDTSGKIAVQGVVMERSMHFLKIAVNEEDEFRVLAARRLRLDLSANTIAHDRALAALVAFAEPGGMPGYDKTSAGARLSATAYSPLQRALVGIPDGGGTLESIAAVPPPRGGSAGVPANYPGGLKAVLAANTNVGQLNPSQQAAVKRALGRTLSVWQGPPGTGKTRTLMAFIEAAVAVAVAAGFGTSGGGGGKTRGPVVLACAASNVAVDNIVEGLVQRGKAGGRLKVVRLGSPAKVQPWLAATTLGAQAALTPPGKRAASLRAEARGDNSVRGAAFRRQAFGLEKAAAELVLSNADVVCATCVGAGDDLLEAYTFRVAVVDEATQCTEPAALIPLSKGLSGVLVGDARQLPPTVISPAAAGAGLGCSLFERLERLGLKPDLLDRQYRMHPALAQFPSAAFYGGRVSSDPTPQSRPLPAGLDWPSPRGAVPLAFVEVDGGQEQRAPDGLSIFNAAEARAAIAVVERLLAAAPQPVGSSGGASVGGRVSVGSAGEIGVIAPYAAQVRVLQELWAESQRRRGGGEGGDRGGPSLASGRQRSAPQPISGGRGRQAATTQGSSGTRSAEERNYPKP